MKTPFIFLIVIFLVLKSNFLSAQMSREDSLFLRTELLKEVNLLRKEKKIKPLLLQDTLRKAAQFHADYILKNKEITHTQKDPKTKTVQIRVAKFNGSNLEYIGENCLLSNTTQLPVSKEDLSALAKKLILQWRNSPPHYENILEVEFTHGDFGFSIDTATLEIYAVQVFAKKGIQVPNQFSTNAFGLTKAPVDCEKEYEEYSNLVANLSSDVQVNGADLYMYYTNMPQLKKIIADKNDGFAIDILHKEQFKCGIPNQLDMHPVFDGVLLPPVYRDELFANNEAGNPNRLISKLATIPEELWDKELSFSLILINNGKACKYLIPLDVPQADYDLIPINAEVKIPEKSELKNKGIILSEEIQLNFKTGEIEAINFPNLSKKYSKIRSVEVECYSSVDGDKIKNEQLHANRAAYIKKKITKQLNFPDSLIKVKAIENWPLMNYQLTYFNRKDLIGKNQDTIKKVIDRERKAGTFPWDSLLLKQRLSRIIIHYEFVPTKTATNQLEEINLREGVLTKNSALVNRALSLIYSKNKNTDIIFEPSIIEYCQSEPKVFANYLALLSKNYKKDYHRTVKILFEMFRKKTAFDELAKQNFAHVYTLISHEFLADWDVDKERMSNIIHPSKIETILPKEASVELTLNIHMTFIRYYSQVNDYPKIKTSYNYIISYFKTKSSSEKQTLKLAKFCNKWSVYPDAIDLLYPYFKNKQLSTDGLFTLLMTYNLYEYKLTEEEYMQLNKECIYVDSQRWLQYMNDFFQLKRDPKLKALYCDTSLKYG